jgi:hypothetical protein
MFLTPAQAGVERKRCAFALSFPHMALSFTQLDLNLDELRYWLIKQASIQPLANQQAPENPSPGMPT